MWVDGSSSHNSNDLANMFLNLQEMDWDKLFVSEIDKDVKKFNAIADKKFKIKYKIDSIIPQYTIPEKYLSIDIFNYACKKLLKHVEEYSFDDIEIENRIDRIHKEMDAISECGMTELFQGVIYIIDEFEKNGVVWGTGRGSSCSSYILYLIGLHEVDSVLYDLDHRDFFRKTKG